MVDPVPLSAVLVVFDEEANVESCLRSVQGWCREIIVLDSGSRDRTLEICRRYTNQIFTHPFTDSASQWSWALANLPISQEWVLPLDADHVVSASLRRDLARVVRNAEPGVDAYFSRHQYIFRGVPIHGFKRYGLRVFRKAAVSVDPSEFVDFRFCIRGQAKKLAGTLYEYNRKELSIDFWIDKHQRFASRVAIEEVLRGMGVIQWKVPGRFFGTPDERIVWMKMLWYRIPLYVRPLLYFLYRYVIRGGMWDGKTGLFYHFMQALWYRALVDIKIADLRRQLRAGKISVDELTAAKSSGNLAA